MQTFSETHNVEKLILTENPNEIVCISAVGDILTENQKLVSNGNAENGNKLRTYRQYKSGLRLNIMLNVIWTAATGVYLPFEVVIYH